MPTKKNIRPPEKLYALFEKYKEDCKAHPRRENFYSQRHEKQLSVDREKPLTWAGFEIYLRKNKIITRLEDYKKNRDGRYDGYVDVIRAIDREIWDDKYTGAVAGIFQHNIIARDLGLTENQKIDHTSGGEKINLNVTVDSDKTAKTLKRLMDGGKTD